MKRLLRRTRYDIIVWYVRRTEYDHEDFGTTFQEFCGPVRKVDSIFSHKKKQLKAMKTFFFTEVSAKNPYSLNYPTDLLVNWSYHCSTGEISVYIICYKIIFLSFSLYRTASGGVLVETTISNSNTWKFSVFPLLSERNWSQTTDIDNYQDKRKWITKQINI